MRTVCHGAEPRRWDELPGAVVTSPVVLVRWGTRGAIEEVETQWLGWIPKPECLAKSSGELFGCGAFQAFICNQKEISPY